MTIRAARWVLGTSPRMTLGVVFGLVRLLSKAIYTHRRRFQVGRNPSEFW